MEIEIGITGLLLLALMFLSLIDLAFGELSDVGLRRMITDAEEARPTAATRFLAVILENRSRFRFTLTAAIQILLVTVAVLVTSIVFQWLTASELFTHTRFITLAVMAGLALAGVFRQLIPRLVVSRNPEAVLLKLLPLLRPVYRPLALVAFSWHSSFDKPRRTVSEHVTEIPSAQEDDDNGDDLQALIDVGEEEGILEEEEGELIHSIIEFGDTRVNEVMTPRTEIVALPLTATVREARDVILDSKYSRLPVYREQIDNIEGLIYVRDLLQYWVDGRESESIETLLRPVYLVPSTKPVAELLEEMQKTHAQLAMVIDEYGGLAGLVTVEDILEEIVGEIEDEDTGSEEVIEIVEANDGYYEVLGSTEVGKIERLFDFEIEDDDFTTIAGLVINELGRVPNAGTTFCFRGLDVEVVDADERRINRLRLRRAAENGAEAE
ncbi:MAG: hemolysin family protein [Pyrinomonadaceae bacterium]|nr:HlyC/CorC family transporter [Pyrinomonadaceae bacterium]MDQ3586023.1 hemolysin family protein [Acidobacteriota bacterium]